jgi:hypothetical protein
MSAKRFITCSVVRNNSDSIKIGRQLEQLFK